MNIEKLNIALGCLETFDGSDPSIVKSFIQKVDAAKAILELTDANTASLAVMKFPAKSIAEIWYNNQVQLQLDLDQQEPQYVSHGFIKFTVGLWEGAIGDLGWQGGLRDALLQKFDVTPTFIKLGKLKDGLVQRPEESVGDFVERVESTHFAMAEVLYPKDYLMLFDRDTYLRIHGCYVLFDFIRGLRPDSDLDSVVASLEKL